jgi:branched-chain amino acid transport system ATP-binding protein
LVGNRCRLLANEIPLFGSAARAEYRDLFHRLVSLAPESVGLGGHSLTKTSQGGDVLLRVTGLESAYGRIKALKGIDIEVRRGEVVALVGANGAGKTTFLRTLSGVQPITAGRIEFDGEDIGRLRADQRVRRGICQSPEGRQVFGPLSIEDNLRLGAYTQPKEQAAGDLARIYEMFPVLQEKRQLPAGTLSGGQQQMLAIGRALMGSPSCSCSTNLRWSRAAAGRGGLQRPGLKSEASRFFCRANASAALSMADRGYVLETGAVTLTGTGAQLLASDDVRRLSRMAARQTAVSLLEGLNTAARNGRCWVPFRRPRAISPEERWSLRPQIQPAAMLAYWSWGTLSERGGSLGLKWDCIAA